jgi:hypothetical protein
VAASDWHFGRSIIPEGVDQVQIRRNFAALRDLIAKLEAAIPFFEEEIADGSVMVKTAGTDRSFTASGATIDIATGLFTLPGDIALAGTVDGEDIKKLKAESSHCLLAVETEVAF